MKFSWGFLKFVYAVVAIVLGAIHLNEVVSWAFGMNVATTVILSISCLWIIIYSILLFATIGKWWKYILMIVAVAAAILPIYYSISWFFEGPLSGLEVLLGGVFIIKVFLA